MFFKRKPKKHPKVLDICEAFIRISEPGTDKGINHKKLPQLVYYSQVISLSVFDRELFNDEIQAAFDGAFIGRIYYNYRRTPTYSHYFENRKLHCDFYPRREVQLEQIEMMSIKLAWKLYGNKHDRYLQSKVVNEQPYKKAREGFSRYEHCGAPIKPEWIKEYYKDKYVIGV